MQDKELLTDFLSSEKKLASNYDSFASECVNTKLRDEFLKLLVQGHQTQTELFNQAQNKGWYQVEQAQTNKVQDAYTKLSQL